jgi:hypothetical protein
VHGGVRGVLPATAVVRRRLERTSGKRGGPSSQLRPFGGAAARAHRLQQLPRGAERERLLERRAARLQHGHVALARRLRGRREQAGLANARWSLDHDECPATDLRAIEPSRQRGQLGIALQQRLDHEPTLRPPHGPCHISVGRGEKIVWVPRCARHGDLAGSHS